MNSQTRRFRVPGPAGAIEVLRDTPLAGHPPHGTAVIAHPHPLFGGTMDNKVVQTLARAFVQAGWAALRFNFRGVGVSAGAFSGGDGELEDYRAGLGFMADQFPGVPLWAAGVSFGSWVAMTAGAQDERVAALMGIAVPAKLYDFSAVRDSRKPKYFIHGEHDELCPLRAVWELYGQSAEPKELVVIDGADHLFDGHVSEVADAIADLLGQ